MRISSGAATSGNNVSIISFASSIGEVSIGVQKSPVFVISKAMVCDMQNSLRCLSHRRAMGWRQTSAAAYAVSVIALATPILSETADRALLSDFIVVAIDQ